MSFEVKYKWGEENNFHTVPNQNEINSSLSFFSSTLGLCPFSHLPYTDLLHILLLSTIVEYALILQFNEVSSPLRQHTNVALPLLCHRKSSNIGIE